MKSTFKGLQRTTPFPNVLIDEVMPRLKDTPWRVLCVIVRQTLGWQVQTSNHRKERDWLTRSQLKARTGRNSEAIAMAIDVLVRQGYIIAQNSDGVLLNTPQKRRANRGRIYYGLTESLQRRIGIMQTRKIEQLPALAGSIFHAQPGKIKHATSEKSNTTKETQTKRETIFSMEIIAFIETFQQIAREHELKPDVTLTSSAHDRLHHWLQKVGKEEQTRTLQKYFCSTWTSIVRLNYSLETFANTCSILRTDQGN